MALSDPPPKSDRSQLLTRTGLRKKAKRVGIELTLPRIDEYIEVGILPDPVVNPWKEEEVLPRFLRFHELDLEVGRSRSRRLIQLHLERFPVEPAKLQRAMAESIPSIERAVRKMQAIDKASAWFSNLPSNRTPGLTFERLLPQDWRLPDEREWPEIILAEYDPETFRSDVGRLDYFCGLLEYMGEHPWQTLKEIPKLERITLLTVSDLAKKQATRRFVIAREEARAREREKAE